MPEVVVGRERAYDFEDLLVSDRVPELKVIGQGEGQFLIEEASQHVEEGHIQDTGPKQVGSHIEASLGHEKPTCTGAFSGKQVRVGYPIGDEELCTGDEILEGVELVQLLAILVPLDPSSAVPSDHSLCYHPAPLHRREVDDVEALVHVKPVSTVTLHEYSIAPVELHCPFLEVNIQRDLLTVVARHPKLLASEVRADDRRAAPQLGICYKRFGLGRVLILVLPVVDEG